MNDRSTLKWHLGRMFGAYELSTKVTVPVKGDGPALEIWRNVK